MPREFGGVGEIFGFEPQGRSAARSGSFWLSSVNVNVNVHVPVNVPVPVHVYVHVHVHVQSRRGQGIELRHFGWNHRGRRGTQRGKFSPS